MPMYKKASCVCVLNWEELGSVRSAITQGIHTLMVVDWEGPYKAYITAPTNEVFMKEPEILRKTVNAEVEVVTWVKHNSVAVESLPKWEGCEQ